jgi:hypothetical protein
MDLIIVSALFIYAMFQERECRRLEKENLIYRKLYLDEQYKEIILHINNDDLLEKVNKLEEYIKNNEK